MILTYYNHWRLYVLAFEWIFMHSPPCPTFDCTCVNLNKHNVKNSWVKNVSWWNCNFLSLAFLSSLYKMFFNVKTWCYRIEKWFLYNKIWIFLKKCSINFIHCNTLLIINFCYFLPASTNVDISFQKSLGQVIISITFSMYMFTRHSVGSYFYCKIKYWIIKKWEIYLIGRSHIGKRIGNGFYFMKQNIRKLSSNKNCNERQALALLNQKWQQW